MKKILLMVCCAGLSLTASAQKENAFVEQQEMNAVEQTEIGIPVKETETEGEESTKPACGVTRSFGTYFVGLSENRYSYGSTSHLVIPNFAKVNFPSYYSPSEVSSIQWSYQDPLSTDLATSTDSVLTVAYLYSKNNSRVTAPTFTASSGDGDSTFVTADYLIIGGGLSSDKAGNYYWANHSICDGGIKRDLSYSSSRYTYNSAATTEKWQGTYSSYTNLKIRGFAEYFKPPVSSYYLKGVTIYGKNTSTFDSDATVTIYKCVYYTKTGNLSRLSGDILATATISKDDITPTKEGGTAYFIKFKNLKDGNGNTIDGVVVNGAIMVALTFNDETTQFMPYYYPTSRKVKNNTHCYLMADYESNGETYTNTPLSATVNWSGGTGTRSFCYLLDADYEYIAHIGTDNKTPYKATKLPCKADEGAWSRIIYASTPYKASESDEPTWTVTSPEWITATITDNYEEGTYTGSSKISLTIAANEGEERTGTVELSYHGAVYNVNVIQEASTVGIEGVTEDTKNTTLYDLQGRKVSQPTKGIYIRNGKKYVVK